MSQTPPRAADPAEGEDPVESLLTRCLLAPDLERQRELDQACAERPELARELRARAAALEALGLWAERPGAPDLPERLGDFQPLQRLGAGGMGVVLRALQVSLGREVALKLVRSDALHFPGSRERFRREVEAVAKLKHPGIVPIYAVGEERGVPYFAMELLEGCTLAEILEELRDVAPADLSGADMARAFAQHSGAPARPLEESVGQRSWVDACLELARRVAGALQHAHERGILHRDVKPSNLMLDAAGRVMLLDFGLASQRGADRTTRTGSQLGTLHYMSPEQVRGVELDPRADVYALGATLYELLTLRPPFEGASALAIQQSILAGGAPGVRALNRRVARDADWVCRMALEPERERRYASAELLATDLGNVLAHRPVLARPPSAARSAARMTRRHPTAAASLSLGLLLASGIPTALYFQKRGHAAQLEESLGRERIARSAESLAKADLERALEDEREARAEERRAREDAESTLGVLGNVLLEATPERLQGRPLVAEDILERGVAAIPTLSEAPGVQRVYLRVLGDAFLHVSRFDRAIELLQRAVELEREASALPTWRRVLALNSLGTALQRRGRLDESIAVFEEALEGCLALLPPGDDGIALLHNNLGGALYQRNDHAGALEHQRQALEIYLRAEPRDAHRVLTARSNMALLLLDLGRSQEAREEADRALAGARESGAIDPTTLGEALNSIAILRDRLGSADEAEALRREAVELPRKVYPDGDTKLALVLYNLGRQLANQGRAQEAFEALDEAVRMMDELGLADHPDAVHFRARLDAVVRQLDGR
jgi:serine/threonine protein kinase